AMGLFFVGREEVGKTCLINALTNTEAHEHDIAPHIDLCSRTAGVSFSQWQPLGKDGPDISIYDFGGISLYRQAQSLLFLQRRALYCLVWRPFQLYKFSDQELELMSPEERALEHYRVQELGLVRRPALQQLLEAQVIPWLEQLYTSVPGCHVMLVGTHSDQVDEAELAWQHSEVTKLVREGVSRLHAEHPDEEVTKLVRERVPRLHAEYPDVSPMQLRNAGNSALVSPMQLRNAGKSALVSSRQGTEIVALRARIVERVVTLPFYGELLPASWVRVRDTLLEIRESRRTQGYKDVKKKPGGKKGDLSGSSRTSLDGGSGRGKSRKEGGAAGGDTANETARGFLWVGDLNKMMRGLGVEDCHLLPLKRYLHDAGGGGASTFGGFDNMDPYRSSGTRLATNSSYELLPKKAPKGFSEQAWPNLLDTIILDPEWLALLIFSIITHNHAAVLSTLKPKP
ncbi:hypothetical protein T484DRAFT_1768515, partial [Baffinella frigidus]